MPYAPRSRALPLRLVLLSTLASALLLASQASALSSSSTPEAFPALRGEAGAWPSISLSSFQRRQASASASASADGDGDARPPPDAVAAALSLAGTQYPTLAPDAATATPTDGSPQRLSSHVIESLQSAALLPAAALPNGAAPSAALAAAKPAGSRAAQTQAGLPKVTAEPEATPSGLLAQMPTGVTGLFGGQAVLPLSTAVVRGDGKASAAAVAPSLSSTVAASPSPVPTAAPFRRQEAEFTFTPGDGAAPLTFTFGSIDPDLPPVTLSAAPEADDGGRSGNDASPLDVNNLEAPDIGWVATIIGGVPYKNGDLAASIVWILATLLLVPLFLVRLLRRSSLIANVLFTVFLFGLAMAATFGVRAYISNNPPTTTLMIAMNAMLAVMPPLLLEPLLNLLGLYAKQGQAGSGVPTVTTILRVFNLVALILYAVAAAYTGIYLSDWDRTLQDPNAVGALSAFPDAVPKQIVRLGPIVASFFMLVAIAGGLLLIPVARGENGSMRPGGFLAVLLILIGISTSYRILQSLHAQGRLEEEANGSTRNPFADIFGLNSSGNTPQPNTFQSMMDDVYRAARGFQVAPVGMYEPGSRGIAWGMLQQALAGRGNPQTPLIFNLVYIFPMWLQTFLLFFVHAPGAKKPPPGDGDA